MLKKRFQLLAKDGIDTLEPGATYTATDIVKVAESYCPYYKLLGISEVYPVTDFFQKKVYIAFSEAKPVQGKPLVNIERMGDGTWEKIPYVGLVTDVVPFLPGIYLVETVDAVYWIILENVPELGNYYFPVIADKAVKSLEIGERYTVIETIKRGDVLYYRLAETEGIYKESCFIKKRFFIASSENAPTENTVLSDFKRYNLSESTFEKVKFGGTPINITQYSQNIFKVETADTVYLFKVK